MTKASSAERIATPAVPPGNVAAKMQCVTTCPVVILPSAMGVSIQAVGAGDRKRAPGKGSAC